MKRIPWPLRAKVYEWLGEKYFPKQLEILRSVSPELTALVIAGGVGAAKSFTLARYLLPEIVFASEMRGINGWPATERLYCWLVGPLYENARAEFKYILDAIRGNEVLLGLVGGIVSGPSMPFEGSWSFTTGNGVEVVTKSWMKDETLHSLPVYLCGVCEAGQLTDNIWLKKIYPRVARAHGVAVEAGTFESYTCFKKHYALGLTGGGERRSWSIATWENTIKYPGGRNDPAILAAEKEYEGNPDEFEERFGAQPQKPTGLVHKYFDLLHHVRPVPFQEHLPLKVGVDPGNYYACLLVQRVGNVAVVHDEYFEGENGTSEQAIEWLCKHPLVKFVRGGAIDARAKDPAALWRSGEIWSKMGRKGVSLNSRNVPVQAGIDRLNSLLFSQNYDRKLTPAGRLIQAGKRLGLPRLFINGKCTNLIWELGEGYRYPKDAEGLQRELPEDKRNHSVKALTYWLVDEFGFVTRSRAGSVAGHDVFKNVRAGRYMPGSVEQSRLSGSIAERLAKSLGLRVVVEE